MSIDLDKLEDSELVAITSRAGELLEQRKARRRQDALDQARTTLERAGLTIRDLVSSARAAVRRKPAFVYRAGFRYRHPDNPALEWAGRGQKPKWLRELERRNVRPIELASEADDPKPKARSIPAARLADAKSDGKLVYFPARREEEN